jgi:protein gp37
MTKTKIEWTESSWNPITGCSKISDGCLNCYAEKMALRLKAMGTKGYENGFEVTLQNHQLERPLKLKKPQMIFVNSMSDIFHEKVPQDYILKIFETMNKADWHIFQVLTKRPERLEELREKINWTKNIWLGTTIESNKYIDRVKFIKETQANIKFISFEPLIDSVKDIDIDGIDWVIVGGESGSGSRAIKKEWIYEIKEKCDKLNIPFFFKQWGGTNKKKSGRLLDGKIYDEMPLNF